MDSFLFISSIVLAVIGTVVLALFFLRRQHSVEMISPQGLQEVLSRAESPLLLDVRSADEFSGELGHIREAVLLPLPELKQRLAELASHRTIVTVCKTARRSSQAAELLRQYGFRSVFVLSGGMEAWNRAGLPVIHTRE